MVCVCVCVREGKKQQTNPSLRCDDLLLLLLVCEEHTS